jgi:2-dehydro-3-deoxyphosphogluconate aldolase / (4S)-4-hydroxy-2-oxoglutarate aldolase
VVACGGSWLTPSDAVGAGDYARITKLAADAVGLVAAARSRAT